MTQHLLLLLLPPVSESHARVADAVRLDLQQQVLHRHVHHPLPQQEGSVRREDQEVGAQHLLPRVHRPEHLRGRGGVHPGPVREQEPLAQQGDLLSPDLRHRHGEHPGRVRRRHRHHHRQQPPRLRLVLS